MPEGDMRGLGEAIGATREESIQKPQPRTEGKRGRRWRREGVRMRLEVGMGITDAVETE